MITDAQKKVLEEYQRQFTEAGYENRIKEDEGLLLLQAGIEDLGDSEDGAALMELCFVPIDEDGSEEDVGNVILFQIYTTLMLDIPAKKEKSILSGLNELNMDCLLGAYGIFKEQMQVYHRYITVLNSADYDQLKGEIGPALNFILTMLYEDYDRVKAICK